MKKYISLILSCVMLLTVVAIPVSAARLPGSEASMSGSVGGYSCGGYLWDGSGYNANTWISTGARGKIAEIYAWIKCHFSYGDRPTNEAKWKTANSIEVDATIDRDDQAYSLYGAHYVILTTGDNWNYIGYDEDENKTFYSYDS